MCKYFATCLLHWNLFSSMKPVSGVILCSENVCISISVTAHMLIYWISMTMVNEWTNYSQVMHDGFVELSQLEKESTIQHFYHSWTYKENIPMQDCSIKSTNAECEVNLQIMNSYKPTGCHTITTAIHCDKWCHPVSIYLKSLWCADTLGWKQPWMNNTLEEMLTFNYTDWQATQAST